MNMNMNFFFNRKTIRKYKSEEYSANNIFLIYGTDNLVQDVKAVYHQEFDEALKAYNENQTRADPTARNWCRFLPPGGAYNPHTV